MFIGHLEVAAIAEFEEGLDRITAGVAGISGEKQFEAAIRLIHHEIGVPVGAANGFADKLLGSLHLLNRFTAVNRGQKAAGRIDLELHELQPRYVRATVERIK